MAPVNLGPLLSPHRSIQAYRFVKRRGICRVFGYALNTRSIPAAGRVTFQYQLGHGVRNMVFPVTMQTYPCSDAPQLEDEASPNPSIGSVQTYDTGNKQSLYSPYQIIGISLLFW